MPSPQRHGAHSGIHRKSSEYNDGADYPEATNNQESKDIGKVAFGNEAEIEDEIEDE